MTPTNLVRKECPSTIAKGAAPRTFEFTITTGAVDRDRDTINPRGWRLAEFRANPVILAFHRYDEPPIARATDVRLAGEALRATVEFPEPGLYDKADIIRRLIENGFLRAMSVGFKPEKWVYDETRGGMNYLEQTLLEVSIVNVPSNASALLAGPSKGVDRAKLARFFDAPRKSGVAEPSVLALADEEEAIITLDDEDVLAGLDADAVRRAMAAVLQQIVTAEVHSAINALRGRVD